MTAEMSDSDCVLTTTDSILGIGNIAPDNLRNRIEILLIRTPLYYILLSIAGEFTNTGCLTSLLSKWLLSDAVTVSQLLM